MNISISSNGSSKDYSQEIIKESKFDMILLPLKEAFLKGNVVKGLKETLKAIETNRAKIVYLAKDCELDNYKKLITDSCSVYNISLIEVGDWTLLRDILMPGDTSKEIIENAKRKGKIAKINPKCYCAATL